MLEVALVTLGSPDQLTGGYLFHRRLAETAPSHDARIEFVAAGLAGREIGTTHHPDVVVVDSIAAWRASVCRAYRPAGITLAAMVHQPPGGIDHGQVRSRIQAIFDRALYRRC